MTKRGEGSARKYRALGYPAHTRLPFGTFSHGKCRECGKLNFASRKDAKTAARVAHPGDNNLRAYPCPRNADYWHYGHTPEWLIRGYDSYAAYWHAQQKEREQDGLPAEGDAERGEA